MSSVIALVLAGGSGERMQAGMNKVFLSLGGETVLCRSIRAFRGQADHLVLVGRPEDKEALGREMDQAREGFLSVTLAPGGATRQASVLNGLRAFPFAEGDIVLVHDGARCLVDEETIRRVIDSCRQHGSGVAAIPCTDTVKRADPGGIVRETPDRNQLFSVQTPQGFQGLLLLAASEAAEREGFIGTDDAGVMEHAGYPVYLVPGDRKNIKLTTKEDLQTAMGFLDLNTAPVFRIGQGYDVHRLTEGRKLILCGVEVPHEKGLLGHSDADVALHALMDAMLGAAALGDIGQHFPDTDPVYEGASSVRLLEECARLLKEKGYQVMNADVTIVAQRPKLAPFIPRMRENIALTLGVPTDRISVKATTTEKLGFEGRMEGISAQAVCLLSPIP